MNWSERQAEIKQFTKEALEEVRKYVEKPEQTLEMADFMAKFPNYSFKNVALIKHQFKGATAVAGYKELVKKGFPVRKGEHGIRILAPVPYQYILDQNGKRKSKRYWSREEKAKVDRGEIEVKNDVWYRNVYVFDISQTNAKPEDLPDIFPNRPYSYDYTQVRNRQALYDALVEFSKKNGVPVKVASLEEWNGQRFGTAKGVFSQSQKGKQIMLSPRLNDDEKIPVLIHEITHSMLHNEQQQSKRDKPLNTVQKEFQAELSSYITAKHYGIDTKKQAIPYIDSWTNNLKEISKEDQIRDINEVQKVSRQITNQIDAKLFVQQEQKQANSQKKETTANYQKFKDQIEKAKDADIVEVIERAGFHLKKESRNQYRGIEHDSLVIDVAKNRYYFNSRKLKGDPISFAQKVVGIDDFKQAVNFVNGLDVDIKKVRTKLQVKKPFKYHQEYEAPTTKQAEDYLVNKRKIDQRVVDIFIEKGLIKQDKRKNVLFIWEDQKGQIKGCSEQGIIHTDKLKRGYWKKIQANSTEGQGFNYLQGRPENLKFFESPIDMLSYISINQGQGKLNNTWLISMDGLKDEVLNHYFKEANQQCEIKSFNLCVDNDQGGDRFAKKYTPFEFQQGEKKVPIERESPAKPFEIKTDKWDWNNERQYEVEQQQASKQTSIEDVEKSLGKFVQSNHLEKNSELSEKENQKTTEQSLKEFIEKNRLKASNKHSEQKLSM